VDETDTELCPVVGFGVDVVKPLVLLLQSWSVSQHVEYFTGYFY
jgi:hypothetical protein